MRKRDDLYVVSVLLDIDTVTYIFSYLFLPITLVMRMRESERQKISRNENECKLFINICRLYVINVFILFLN